MELTKEYFDEKLNSLVTKEYFEQRLEEKISHLVTKDYFDETLELRLEKKLDPIRNDIRDIKLDLSEVKETVEKIDKRDREDSDLLAKTYVNHDLRLNRIEKALNLKKIKTA
jgi:hypothetical protein